MSKTKKAVVGEKQSSLGKYSFIIALGIGTLIFLPFIIEGRGLFTFYGDYNSQQIPFYQLAHKAIRTGDFYWSWYTDLGSSFLGSYSFYLLFSPFFWLTLPFPNDFVPYLMAPLLILKTALASLTAYHYLARFVKDRRNAVIGGLLYCFSGWMFNSIFYNHFHEVMIFFPLLLIGVEKLVTENKKLVFVLAVAVNAMVNYWFFLGEVVFVVIYVLVRWYSGDWQGMNGKKLVSIGFESLLGLLIAAVVLLPSLGALIGNARVGNLLDGWGLISYWQDPAQGGFPQRSFAIIAAFFFPPEHPAYPNMFPSNGAGWASIAGWLPMFSMVGVIAYFVQKRAEQSWLKKILVLLGVISLVPVFNALFTAFNRTYYARWFYMLTLLTALATVMALDNINLENGKNSFKDGIKWVFIITTVTTILLGLSPTFYDGGEVTFGLVQSPIRLWVWYGFVVVGLIILALLILVFARKGKLEKHLGIALSVYIAVFGIGYLYSATDLFPRGEMIRDVALGGRGEFDLPEAPFARSDIYDDMDNLLMYWQQPNIQTFHSVVSPSIIEFYDSLGVKREEASRPSFEDYPLRSLLSVRWLFVAEGNENQQPMPYYIYYDTQNGYNIYENLGFVPMGFAYDYQLSQDYLMALPEAMRSNALLHGVVINDSPSEYTHLLPYLSIEELLAVSHDNYMDYCAARASAGVKDFYTDNKGFYASTNYEKENLVFFSVPYDSGWRAVVNGAPANIIRVNNGFMAVIVPEGESEIAFSYFPPYLKLGAAVSLGGIVILIVYLGLSQTFKKKREDREKKELLSERRGFDAYTLSWAEYQNIHGGTDGEKTTLGRLEQEEEKELLERLEKISGEDNNMGGDE